MRIIGGRWRGRRLPVPDLPGLRPSGDRGRETLFNWLAPVIHGAHCADLFAGTGALGLEAASRGAATVVLVEKADHLGGRMAELSGLYLNFDAAANLLQRKIDAVLNHPNIQVITEAEVQTIIDALDAGFATV